MRRPATILAFTFFGFIGAASLGSLATAADPPKPAAAAAKPAAGAPSAKPAAGAPSAKPAGSAVTAGAPAGSAAPASSAATPTTPATGAAGGSAPTATGQGAVEKPAMDGATYSVRLRDLEARVDELKDQIRRSHTRLALLSDTILTGGAAGSRSEVVYHNEMSSAFRLTRALFVIDGTVQYNKQDDTGALADQKEIPIFSGSIPPGDHTVQVVLNFQGNGYGVFTYLRGYKFEVKSAHSFTAVEGKTLTLTATSLEKGGVTTPLEQRPSIEWNEKVQGLGQSSLPAAPAGQQPQAPSTPSGGAGGGASTTPTGGSGNVSIGAGK